MAPYESDYDNNKYYYNNNGRWVGFAGGLIGWSGGSDQPVKSTAPTDSVGAVDLIGIRQ